MKLHIKVCSFAMMMALLLCPNARADRVDDLEKIVQDLVKQNQTLKEQVNSLQNEVKELRSPQPAAPVGESEASGLKSQFESFKEEVKGLLGQEGKDPDAPKYSVGADFRMRGVSMDNMWNLDLPGGINYDDSWEWYRMRSRLWFQGDLTDGLSGYFRGANEYKWGLGEKADTLNIDPDFDSLLGNKEWFVDNAYMDWKSPFGADWLSLRIGRQDLIYGEGFLILDGQSNVGSMAIGFDAAKATITLDDETKSSFDLIYSKIHEHTKQFADDEDFFALYGRTDALNPVHLEPYLMYRNKNGVETYDLPGNAWPAPLGPDLFIDPELDTILLGSRATAKVFDDLLLVAEGGYQWGNIENPTGLAFLNTDSYGRDSVERRAWALYGHGTYTFSQVPMTPYIKAGYTFMSGDDPDTSDYEGWDSFYAEWPKWSEGLIYQLYDPFVPLKITDNGPTDRDLGSWTNMKIATIETGLKPIKGLDLTFNYNFLWADQENSLINDDDDERGHLLTGLASYQFNKYLSGHLLGEYFIPGGFYDPDGPAEPDDAFFIRYQLMLKF